MNLVLYQGHSKAGTLPQDDGSTGQILAALVAAAMALVISGSRPSAPISTSSAAAVVPPGEVTFWRKVEAGSVERCRSSPEPVTVSRASFSASAAGRPAATPACAITSASRKT